MIQSIGCWKVKYTVHSSLNFVSPIVISFRTRFQNAPLKIMSAQVSTIVLFFSLEKHLEAHRRCNIYHDQVVSC
jgi:hypothetical protein